MTTGVHADMLQDSSSACVVFSSTTLYLCLKNLVLQLSLDLLWVSQQIGELTGQYSMLQGVYA